VSEANDLHRNVGLQRIDEIVNRYASLFEQTGKRAGL